MPSDKEIKKDFKSRAQKSPDKFYPTSVLKGHGFDRRKCIHCGNWFWSTVDKNHCEEPECREASGHAPYGFIGKSPCKKKFSYTDTWEKAWVKVFKKLGHTPIPRYPIVARWRDDTYWVRASIYDFQPHVVSGAVAPPANPLIVPQICIRTNDIDNVGLSGRHYSTFIMVGQHVFNTPDRFIYFKDEAIDYIIQYLRDGIGLPLNDITFHEDAWAGGGNFGASMEFFSQGLEIGNQVYMQYEVTPGGNRELDTKVIDMGAGYERSPWLMHGTPTSYDTTFPHVLKKLYKATGIKPDKKIWSRYANLSGTMNVDEVDIEKAWFKIAQKIGTDEQTLRDKIYPMRAIYAIADHTRSLLVALNDGALPSNVGGGYSLRYLLRRCWSLQKEFDFNFELPDVFSWHMAEFGKLFPELNDSIVPEILSIEKDRYEETLRRGRKLISTALDRGKLDVSEMIRLYDSNGILPEMIQEVAKSSGKRVKIPDDFYNRLDDLHSRHREIKKLRHNDLPALSPTLRLYDTLDFTAKVLWSRDKEVILDRTAFYPTSGGQEHDVGTLDGVKVVDVVKEGPYVIHVLEKPLKSKKVRGIVESERRMTLTRHHTATHIVNAAAREVLGEHVWQAGAEKTVEKARLDITHYASITAGQLDKIELAANRMVLENIPISKVERSRSDAESEYGFSIYQGGAVPGEKLRIVSIGQRDIEACGGTHCDSTGEVGMIQLVSAERIQDGVVRLEFTAGMPAVLFALSQKRLLREASSTFSVMPEILPKTAERFFEEWKEQKKKIDFFTHQLAELQSSNVSAKKIHGLSVVCEIMDVSFKRLQSMAQELSGSHDLVILASSEGSASVVVASSSNISALEVAETLTRAVGGSAGGNERFACGGGPKGKKLKKAIDTLLEHLNKKGSV